MISPESGVIPSGVEDLSCAVRRYASNRDPSSPSRTGVAQDDNPFDAELVRLQATGRQCFQLLLTSSWRLRIQCSTNNRPNEDTISTSVFQKNTLALRPK